MQMRRQRDEALKHCGDMLRALQLVSQAVLPGNVDHGGGGHRTSLTENLEHPYSSGIGPEFILNCKDNLPPTSDLSTGGAEGQIFPPVNDFNWHRGNGGYNQFNSGPGLICPEYGGIGGDDQSEYVELS